MLIDTHHAASVDWYAPIVPDREPPRSGPDSPITRRLLDLLRLRPGERVLVVDSRDPELLVRAAELVGPSGRVRCVESSGTTLRRLARHLSAHRDVELVLGEAADLGRATEGWDAVAWVHRNGLVPDASLVRRMTDALVAEGRLAVAAFDAPAGRIAAIGSVGRARHGRTSTEGFGRSRRPSATGRRRPERTTRHLATRAERAPHRHQHP